VSLQLTALFGLKVLGKGGGDLERE